MARARRETWERRVAAWRDSGLTAREFAARIGVNANTLANWKWKLDSEDRASEKGPAFVEVTEAVVAAAELGATPMEVVCDGGRVVRVPRDFDSAMLLRLLDVLEGR
jgi:transposase-like protein